MESELKCPKCGSIDVSQEDWDANQGACGDPDCCGGPYWMLELHCSACRHWERVTQDDLDENETEWKRGKSKEGTE